LKDFFYKQYDREAYRTRRNEVLSRLDLLLTSDPIRKMMLVPKSNFNIAEAMDVGKIIIINNSTTLLGEYGSEFIGRYFVSQIWAAATARSDRKQQDKKPCYFYIDEAHRVIRRDEKVAQIIDECRSQKLALIIAHQRCDQVESNVLSALSNCALRYANTDTDARMVAPLLRTTSQFIDALRVGQFAVFVRDLTLRAIALTVTPANTQGLLRIKSPLPLPAPLAQPVPELAIPSEPVPSKKAWDV
jgi:hypothetical protein